MTNNSNIDRTIVKKYKHLDANCKDFTFSTECEILSLEGIIKINFYIFVTKNILSLNETKIFQKKYYESLFNRQNKSENYNDLLHSKKTTKYKKGWRIIDCFRTIRQPRNDFSLFHNFRKRQISTFYGNTLVASTIMDVDADVHSFVSRDIISAPKQFLIEVHAANVNYSEFMIQHKFNQLIVRLKTFAHFWAIFFMLLSPGLWFGFNYDYVMNYDLVKIINLEMLIYTIAVPIAVFFARIMILRHIWKYVLGLLSDVMVKPDTKTELIP